MNHSPSGSLGLKKAISGFLNYKTAEGLAHRRLYDFDARWSPAPSGDARYHLHGGEIEPGLRYAPESHPRGRTKNRPAESSQRTFPLEGNFP